MNSIHFLAIHMPGFEEWIVIAVIGVIVFGKRLPEVGKNVAKSIVEFKKGLKGVEDEVDRQSSMTPQYNAPALQTSAPVGNIAASAPKYDQVINEPATPVAIPPGAKFDPFTGKPIVTE